MLERPRAGYARPWAEEFAGSRVIVTGASSGIGQAIATAFGEAGAKVLAVGRNQDRLAETAAAIDSAPGECVQLIQDLREPGAARAIADAAAGELGGLDVLVLGAGVFRPQPFTETPLESLDEQYAVNVRAPYELLQLTLGDLVESSGNAVLVSSISGIVGSRNATAYCSTKGAVELLTKSLALEVSDQGVRINSVAPGNVHTPMNAHLFADPAYERAALDATPAGRIGDVHDIAAAVLYLGSSLAAYVTGATLIVDGGWTSS